MQSRDLLAILIDAPELFTKTVYEAPPLTADQIARFGRPRHYWRARLTPRARYDTAHGQWMLNGTPVDERVIRNAAVQALVEGRSFNGADIALALDLLKATTKLRDRIATKQEIASASHMPELPCNTPVAQVGWITPDGGR